MEAVAGFLEPSLKTEEGTKILPDFIFSVMSMS